MVTRTLSTETGWQIERAQAGDSMAFEALLHHYERPLYGFIYRMMGSNAEDAADLLQETFLKVYRALDRIPPGANLTAWLYRVARNCCIDELRRRKRGQWAVWDGMHGTPMIEPSAEIDPESAVIQHEGDGVVTAALVRMSRRNREALILRECQGLSCEEIGAVFGISRKAVKSMLFRAREEFRRAMQMHPIPDSGHLGESTQWQAA